LFVGNDDAGPFLAPFIILFSTMNCLVRIPPERSHIAAFFRDKDGNAGLPNEKPKGREKQSHQCMPDMR
jgi:hypothetical protein